MLKHTWSIGSFLGLAAVGLGALGAHALKDDLSAAQLTSFETAVRYQFYHALVLLVLFLAKDRLSVTQIEFGCYTVYCRNFMLFRVNLPLIL
jgi:uncharacterized membrane protein YgdD (TMEM256/DUF423 family)